MNKVEVIQKIREMKNGMITIKVEDGQIISTSIQENDMSYREG